MWNTLQKVRFSLRRAGLLRTVQRAVQQTVPSWLFDCNYLIVFMWDLADWRLPAVADDWPYRWAEEKDLEVLTQGGLSTEEIRAFQDQDALAAM